MTMKRKIFLSLIAAAILTVTVFVFGGCGFRGFGTVYPNAGKYTAGDGEISGTVEKIDADWTSGKIILKTDGESTVRISEDIEGNDSDDAKVHWWLDGTTLRIQFMASGVAFGGVKKELTIILPESMILNEADFDTASADVTGVLNAKEVEIDTASGKVDVETPCKTEDIKIDTSSGNVNLKVSGKAGGISVDSSSGKIALEIADAEKLKVDTSSGDITAEFASVPGSCSIDSSSGSVTVKVPEDGDYTFDVDTASGDFESDISLKISDGKYVCGDGSSKISIDTSSGNIYVKKR